MFLDSWSSICGSWAWNDNRVHIWNLKFTQRHLCIHQWTTCSQWVHSHAWPVYCGGWVHGVVWCWSATSLSSSCRQTWTPGTSALLHTPVVQRTQVSLQQLDSIQRWVQVSPLQRDVKQTLHVYCQGCMPGWSDCWRLSNYIMAFNQVQWDLDLGFTPQRPYKWGVYPSL